MRTVLEAVREERMIRTHDELMALPAGTIVLDADGDKYWRDGLSDPADCWFPVGLDYGDDGHQIVLPALVMVA